MSDRIINLKKKPTKNLQTEKQENTKKNEPNSSTALKYPQTKNSNSLLTDTREEKNKEPEKIDDGFAPTDVAIGQPRFLFQEEPVSWLGPQYYKLGNYRNTAILSIILFVIGGLFYIFLGHDIITLILIVLLGIMTLVYGAKTPSTIEFEIAPSHVAIQDTVYPVDEIESFWIHYVPELDMHELTLKLKKWHRQYVRIPLQSQDPVQIRQILIESIPEEEHEDTLGEILMRRAGL